MFLNDPRADGSLNEGSTDLPLTGWRPLLSEVRHLGEASKAAPSLAPGERVGRYTVLECLDCGGQGAVYRALDAELDRQVAIKIGPAEVEGPAPAPPRLQLEGRILAQLSHPRIARVLDIGQHHARPFVVLELLRGETLASRLRRGTLSSRRVWRLIADVAEGLAAAHRQGVLHLDLKPENVFVSASGRATLLDFGLGWRIVDAAKFQYPGPYGTPGFQAPEQVDDQGVPWTPATDVFGLGCLVTACTGPPPGEMRAVDSVSRPGPSTRLSRRMQEVRRRALAPSPDDRPRDADEFLRHWKQCRGRSSLAYGCWAAGAALLFTAAVSSPTCSPPLEARPGLPATLASVNAAEVREALNVVQPLARLADAATTATRRVEVVIRHESTPDTTTRTYLWLPDRGFLPAPPALINAEGLVLRARTTSETVAVIRLVADGENDRLLESWSEWLQRARHASGGASAVREGLPVEASTDGGQALLLPLRSAALPPHRYTVWTGPDRLDLESGAPIHWSEAPAWILRAQTASTVNLDEL